MSQERLRLLLELSRTNDRICPNAAKWHQLWELLGSPSGVPPPLVLSGWAFSTDRQKRDRFAQHLEFAAETGKLSDVEQFVSTLADDEWHRSPEGHLDWSYGDALRQEEDARQDAVQEARRYYACLRTLTNEPAYEQPAFFETLWCYWLLFATDDVAEFYKGLDKTLKSYSGLVDDPDYTFFDESISSLAADTCREIARQKRIEAAMINILMCISPPDRSGHIHVDRDCVSEFLDDVFARPQ